MARWWSISTSAAMSVAACSAFAFAQATSHAACPIPAPGGVVDSPQELRSRDGILRVNLAFRSGVDSDGRTRYCYVASNGELAPTLRLNPGDLLILKLRNEVAAGVEQSRRNAASPDCAAEMMMSGATNLHFHGLAIPPVCHQDDSLHTMIAPSAKEFEYRFRIPATQPPGLYWYHPHPHGHSEEQVLGGASGALIVDGMELAGKNLPERVFVIRDQKLPAAMATIKDAARPAKDLSINFVPLPYPDYPSAVIKTQPSSRELWRVVNASADTYLDLFVLFGGKFQKLGLVALDGAPIAYGSKSTESVVWKNDIPIPPGGRAEFIFISPAAGEKAQLLTAGVDTTSVGGEDNPGGGALPDDDDYTPPRPLAQIVASKDVVEPHIDKEHAVQRNSLPSLATVQPVHQRKLYFSEKVMDPKHPAASTVFYLTEEGKLPAPFDPAVTTPNITVRVGDVEDWTIENRSQESHDFHIHQTHFLVLEQDGKPADGYLRDTVDVPFWDGVSAEYPSVKLRMDFRDPDIVGTFPYHCHILQHADGGMMGLIRVERR